MAGRFIPEEIRHAGGQYRRHWHLQAGLHPADTNGLTTNATPFWMVAGSGVEIEVDTETGRVRITRLINVADVGKPINPKIVETQLSGASLMQLGLACSRKCILTVARSLMLRSPITRSRVFTMYRQ